MPLLATVGRKSLQPRLLLAACYALLVLGAISMVYPFLLMVSNSTTTDYDWRRFRLVPRYLHDDRDLFAKHIADKDGRLLFGERYGRSALNPNNIRPGDFEWLFRLPESHRRARAQDLQQFIREGCPERFIFPAFAWQNQRSYSPFWLRDVYIAWLKERYATIGKVNIAHGYPYRQWTDIVPRGLDPLLHSQLQSESKNIRDLTEFALALRISAPEKVSLITADAVFQNYLAARYGVIERFNLKNGTGYSDFTKIHLDDLRPKGELALDATEADALRQRPLEFFLRRMLPLQFYRLDPSLRADYESYLSQQGLTPTEHPFTELAPATQKRVVPWIRFVEETAPLDMIRVEDPLSAWRTFLRERYCSDLDALNRAHGSSQRGWEEIQRLPIPELDWDCVAERAWTFRWRYLTANYAEVIGFIIGHGRAFVNTVIYVALSILGALTVNPMAAYALARFRLGYANKILIFLLATMAFPAEVAMIPGFLLVRDIGLLNTFWALVLPGLASGFSIFLLKGFFESLPAELYEAALLDGAGELRMFWNITLPLCKPILAVIALGAFTSAYGAFMFAFLTCQNPQMWTLMVFLYEFQQMSSNGLIMASLVAAAVPTLLVFIFCQRIILRGIVIPSFK